MNLTRHKWDFGISEKLSGLLKKSELVETDISYMMSKCQDIFIYKNLPETIPDYLFESMIESNGHVTVTETDDNKLYAFFGSLGGQDEYYEPYYSIVANPYLRFNKTVYIKDDFMITGNKKNAVLVRNDAYMNSLLPLHHKNALIQADSYLTIQFNLIYQRLPLLLLAKNDNVKASIDKLINDVIKGESISSIVAVNSAMVDSLNTKDFSKGTNYNIKDIMEIQQYFLAQWNNTLGINSSFNMKRESLTESELTVNEDVLLPYISQMLHWRKKGVDEINEMYGTNITVELSEMWKKKVEELTSSDESDETSDDETSDDETSDDETSDDETSENQSKDGENEDVEN